jgi:2-aminoadipate transaminase
VLELDELVPHIDRLKAMFRSRKSVLCQSLRDQCPDLSFAEPSGGYFVWALLPDGVDADVLLAEAQAKHGVAFTPGSRCSLGETNCKDGQHVDVSRFVRLSFAFYSEEEIAEGVERLRRSLDAVTRSGP